MRQLWLSSWLILAVLSAPTVPAEDWPGWRGPCGDGTSLDPHVPLRWNGETGENVRWKCELPGEGHSSPIVWRDTVFVTACRPQDQARLLVAIDATTGQVKWQQTVLVAPLEKRHKLNSHASGTPATDGERVYVSFLEADFSSLSERTPGNLVVAAYDFQGKQLWQVKAGRFASVHGFCSSPVLFENRVIVNGDHDGDGYIVALDKATGDEVWRIRRPNNTRSYVTPLLRDVGGRTQMVLSGSRCVASYDPRSGQELWYMDGPTEQFVASLVFNGEYFYLTAGFPDRHILAIKPDGRGKVGDEQIVWRTTRNCSYVPSPVICGEYFLVVSDNGVASCLDARTGEPAWVRRLDTKNHSASLITARDHVFFVADDGVTRVVRPGSTYELVAENPLGEDCYASPAVSAGRLYLRGARHLFCIQSERVVGDSLRDSRRKPSVAERPSYGSD